jgi:hypothetical protein
MIPYSQPYVSDFGASEDYAWVPTFAYNDDENYITTPINPNSTDTIEVFQGFSWAAIGNGDLHDLQVCLPTGSASGPGVQVYAQIWTQPATQGGWTGTAFMATYNMPPTGLVQPIFSNNADLQPFSQGDRIALVLSTDTGSFDPVNTDNGASLGLGYTIYSI